VDIQKDIQLVKRPASAMLKSIFNTCRVTTW